MKISEILSFLEVKELSFAFFGNKEEEVDRFSSLSRYQPGTFTWIKSEANIPDGLDLSNVSLAFVAEDVAVGAIPNVIRTSKSKYAFFSTIEHFFPCEEDRPAIGQFTYISPKVKLGKNVHIGHNCTIDGDITIGDNTIIWNNVVIVNRVLIGQNCEIQSGSIIGHDGFGYTEDDSHKKTMIKHFGGVRIGDHVLISSNVCICRGTIDDTVLSDGIKIDNLSHIAHNCFLEPDVALAYPCKLGGSTYIGRNGYLAAAVVRNQTNIGANAFVGLGAVTIRSVDAGQIVVGNPARPLVKSED